MIIAAAQTSPKDGNIEQNLNDHYRLINIAADNGIKLIVFPEMSITGYVRELAQKLSFTKNDSRLDALRKLATDKKIIVVAGAPIKIDATLCIGSFVIYPNNTISIYTKQFLHTGEDEFFTPNFNNNPTISIDNEQISLAICADINNSMHAENAKKANSTIYIASIFFTNTAITEAYNLLGNYAKNFSMNVLMSNYCGKSWGLEAGGKSALWSNNGDLMNGLDASSTGLVIAQKSGDLWNGTIIKDRC